MKLRVGVFSAEGFLTGIAFQFDNGLTMRTAEKLVWCGEKRRKEIEQEVADVLDNLERLGVEVDRTAYDNFKTGDPTQ